MITALIWSASKKSTSRKAKILFKTIIGSFAIGGMAFVVMVILLIRLLSPPPTPGTTHGEFSFRLEYEIDGERFVIEDTLIAEYIRSHGRNVIDPAFRVWSTSFLDGSLTYEESWFRWSLRIKTTDEVVIRFHPGHASYFMNDFIYGWRGNRNARSLYRFWSPVISFTFSDGDVEIFVQTSDYVADALYEHGIILIDWWYTPPI